LGFRFFGAFAARKWTNVWAFFKFPMKKYAKLKRRSKAPNAKWPNVCLVLSGENPERFGTFVCSWFAFWTLRGWGWFGIH